MDKKSLLKKVVTRLTTGAAVALLAVGVLGSSQALAGIANTKHNLGSGGTGANKFSGTAEICVFCHTPHGADASASVPLWNKTLPAASTYTTYNSLGTSSLDGATAPVGSVSLACLSCHDGSQAMNSVINAPGSGSVVASYTAGTWTGSANPTGIALLGKDISNDHPVGIQYGGGMPGAGNAAYTAGTIAAGALRDPDFKAAQHKSINGSSVWWVDTSGAGTREKVDMMLYTRTGGTALAGKTNSTTGGTAFTGDQAFVECASCHDPHVENVAGSNPTFLRIANTGSAVCLACHTK